MYGVITTYRFKAALTPELIDQIRREAIEPMVRQPGFHHYFAVSGESGEVAACHFWDSREQAEAALAVMAPLLAPLVQHLLAEAPVRTAAPLAIQIGA